jgi:hypothetical protein
MSEECCYPWDCDTKRHLINFELKPKSFQNEFHVGNAVEGTDCVAKHCAGTSGRSAQQVNSEWTYMFMFTVLALSVMMALVSEFSMFRMTTNASMVFSGCMGMIVYVTCWLWLMNKQDGYA